MAQAWYWAEVFGRDGMRGDQAFSVWILSSNLAVRRKREVRIGSLKREPLNV